MAVPAPPLPPQRGTRVIKAADDLRPAFSINQETDARTAIARGLKEYLEQLFYQASGGRQVHFRHVFDTWAQAESNAEYPSAAVVARGEGVYDASKFTPQVESAAEGLGVVQTSELRIDADVGVWATDNKERMALVAMLERDLVPTEFMYGLRLELPHYFNARAEYELASMNYVDSAEDAMRRHRRAMLLVHATMPVLRLVKLPKMLPSGSILAQPGSGPGFLTPGGGVTGVFT